MNKFKIGDKVKTPGGIGTVYSVNWHKGTLDIEMHYTYLVEYKIEDCKKIGAE